MIADLPVPDEAVERLFSLPIFDDREQYVEHVRNVSAPVVIAELRRLCPGDYVTRRDVQARIDELEGR